MTIFTITITDPIQLLGVTQARTNFNNSLPQTIPDPTDLTGKKTTPNPALLATDQAYVSQVLTSAAQSWAQSVNITDAQITKMTSDLAAAKSIRGLP